MGELVIVKKIKKEEVVVTTSKIIAESVNIQHKNIIELIYKHKERLERKSGVTFKTETQFTGRGGSQQVKYCILTERQATLLVTFMKNTDEVADFKEKLVDEFLMMREFIREKQTCEWKEARKESKLQNRDLTDEIKRFVEYAKSKGSNKPNMYYIHFQKLINKAQGVSCNKRDSLDKKQLRTQHFIIDIIVNEISVGICNNLNYKDIYKICKEKVEYFVSCFNLKLK